MRRILLAIISIALLSSCGVGRSSKSLGYIGGDISDKREFRGSWLPTIFRSEYMGLTREEGRQVLGNRIALLHQIGCNVVIFQVRAEGDAWYRSEHEPWSRFFTGKQGEAPSDIWDPLAFVIEECHRRGMELHAWINPYRGAINRSTALSFEHLASKSPELFISYGNQLWLDPGVPASRKHVIKIVKDIAMRYDIDALHMDDYFYPYPINGEEFGDDKSFERYGLTAGYPPSDRNRWRRNNVNLLIYEIRQALLQTKPWVRFGISPFGIYRNQSTDPKGSLTNGLQSYDDLHADVLHWANEGWIDYIAPQVYWNIGNKRADYEELIKWWRKRIINKKVHLYIGQDVERTMDGDQLEQKLLLSRGYADGNIYWPADELVKNYRGISDDLRSHYHRYRALLPEYLAPLGKTYAPKRLRVVWEDYNEDGHMIVWQDERNHHDPESAYMYVVYLFPEGESANVKRHQFIVSISTTPQYVLPKLDGMTNYTVLVTAVNKFWQESKPYKLKVRI